MTDNLGELMFIAGIIGTLISAVFILIHVISVKKTAADLRAGKRKK